MIIIIIAQQSAIGLVDKHLSHQHELGYVQILEELQNPNMPNYFHYDLIDKDISSSEFDCDHCCHCHNLQLYYSSFGKMFPKASFQSYLLSYYQQLEYSQLYSSHFRPPRGKF